MTMGTIPTGTTSPASYDSLIADTIGTRTRFRSIEVALNGGRNSRSKRAGATTNPAEPSPAALYARIFGPEFKDPNAADFTPDTMVMARRSVLSYVSDQRKSIMTQFGSADKARLDQYFTAIREIEQQLDLEMQRPAPMPNCTAAEKFEEATPGALVDSVVKNSKLFGGADGARARLRPDPRVQRQRRVAQGRFASRLRPRPGMAGPMRNMSTKSWGTSRKSRRSS